MLHEGSSWNYCCYKNLTSAAENILDINKIDYLISFLYYNMSSSLYGSGGLHWHWGLFKDVSFIAHPPPPNEPKLTNNDPGCPSD